MGYAPILRLTLAHDYYDDALPPIAAAPTEPAGFARAGLLLRQSGGVVTVIAEEGAARPEALQLTLLAASPDLFAVTEGADWRAVPHVTLGPQAEDYRFAALLPTGFAGLAPPPGEPQDRARLLARLTIALPAEGARDVSLAFDAVAALWAYHLTGARSDGDLQIVDALGAVAFDDLGLHPLPGGTRAKVLRSAAPVPARARPSQRFALQRPSPFGPETLIPVLPAAGIQFKPVTEPGAAARLQSDIYVTLW